MTYFPPECGNGTSTCSPKQPHTQKEKKKALALLYSLSVEMRGPSPPRLRGKGSFVRCNLEELSLSFWLSSLLGTPGLWCTPKLFMFQLWFWLLWDVLFTNATAVGDGDWNAISTKPNLSTTRSQVHHAAPSHMGIRSIILSYVFAKSQRYNNSRFEQMWGYQIFPEGVCLPHLCDLIVITGNWFWPRLCEVQQETELFDAWETKNEGESGLVEFAFYCKGVPSKLLISLNQMSMYVSFFLQAEFNWCLTK